ncbi:AAA family ATPase [Amnibacterium kyonggiense]
MRARRILVAGPSGSGKTTLARRIAAAAGVPHTELDGLHWLAGWTPNPDFDAEVAALAATDAWVTEFQYQRVRPLLASRADLLVWLRPPSAVVLQRVVRRTVLRRLRGQVLWNGNVEAPLRTFFTDPDHIVRWSARTMGDAEGWVRGAKAVAPALPVVQVRSRRDAARLLALLRADRFGAR